MTSEEALEAEIETPLTYVERNGVYYQVPAWVEKDLEVLEELTVLKDYYPPFKEFLKDMLAKGENEDLEKLKEWIEND